MTPRLQIIIDGVHRELLANEDTTGDGRSDTVSLHLDGSIYRITDLDGDGIPDVIRVVRPDNSRYLMMLGEHSRQYEIISDTDAHDDSVEEDASHWFAQATNYTCGPAAITMVLADLLDHRMPDETVVWRRALDLEAISHSGMLPRDIERVMSSYGIPSRLVQSDTRELEQLLERGHEVILMVDADEYWPGFDGRGENDVLRKRPHAVRVLGIDHASGVAVVSDSGRPDPLFSRLQVPLEHLNDAWQDLEWLAVITEITHEQVRLNLTEAHMARAQLADTHPTSPPAVAEQIGDVPRFEGRHRRTIFLPFVLRASRIIEALRRQRTAGRRRQ